MKRTTSIHPAPSARPIRPAIAAARPGRRGIVLLFVVVLLTLLAVLGSAYLVTSRIDRGQLGNDARGGPADAYGRNARNTLDQVLAEAENAAKLQLFLDAFARTSTLPPTPPAFPTAERDITGLAWRPAEGTEDTMFGATITVPAAAVDFRVRILPVPPFAGLATNSAVTLRHPYYHVDAEGGTDPHLASRHPMITPSAAALELVWGQVSAPLAGLPGFPIDNMFVDPFRPGVVAIDFDPSIAIVPNDPANPDRSRARLLPTTTPPVEYDAPAAEQSFTSNPQFYNDRLRVWPALLADSNVLGGDGTYDLANDFLFTAGDADGDGVADGGMAPIVWDATQPRGNVNRYIDPATNLAFLVTVRIVDNNAVPNVNTALTRYGEKELNPAGGNDDNLANTNLTQFGEVVYDDPTSTNFRFTLPNRGVHLSNVGLLELFYDNDFDAIVGRDDTAPRDGIDDNGAGQTRNAQFQRFVPTMLGNATAMAVTDTSGVPAAAPTMTFTTLGDLLSMNLARRLAATEVTTPGPIAFTADGTSPFTPFRADADDAAFSFNGGGWIIAGANPSRVEGALNDGLRFAAANYVPNPDLQFEFFPLGVDVALTGQEWNVGTDPTLNKSLRIMWTLLFKNSDPDFTDFETATGGEVFRSMNGNRPLPLSPRSAMVARNGVSQTFRPKGLDGLAAGDLSLLTLPTGMPQYGPATLVSARAPVRAGANTAGFAELWRAYWNVMVEQTPGNAPVTNVPGFDPLIIPAGDLRRTDERMFRNDLFQDRSSLINPAAAPNEYMVLTMRAAVAATNTMDIRDIATPATPGDDLPTAADISIEPQPDVLPGPPAPPDVHYARVYGAEAQPFITEVIVTTNAATVEYVAIELFNPYPYDLDLSNWQLVAVGRDLGTPNVIDPALDIESMVTAGAFTGLGAGAVVPAGGFLVLSSGAPPAGSTITPPAGAEERVLLNAASALTVGGGSLVVREIVLMRPINNPIIIPPDGLTLVDVMAPADSVDPSGVDAAAPLPPAGTSPNQWRYVRATAIDTDSDPNVTVLALEPRAWTFVSHGAYRPSPPLGETRSAGMRRMLVVDVGGLGLMEGPDDVSPEYGPIRSIPWGPAGAGPMRLGNPATPVYPFGGFARDGDLLNVPFIGGYRIYRESDGVPGLDIAADELIEIVSPTLDAWYAESPTAAQTVAVGRFLPRGEDYDYDPPPPPVIPQDRGYDWAADLFEYVTAMHAPGRDFLPQADPRYSGDPAISGVDNRLIANFGDIPVPSVTTLFNRNPLPINNDGQFDDLNGNGTFDAGEDANTYLEAFQPVEGLINLNTASHGILKLLPLAVDTGGHPDVDRISGAVAGSSDPRIGLAGSVLLGRALPRDWLAIPATVPRAYESVFELNGLPEDNGTPAAAAFRDLAAGSTRRNQGDISGFVPPPTAFPVVGDLGTDSGATSDYYIDRTPVPGPTVVDADFETPTLQMTRISNLVTTRSDSYTVYILVQAWENFGQGPTTAAPARLVRQKRVAFTVDRSGVLPYNARTGAAWTRGTTQAELDQFTADAFDSLEVTPVPVR